MNNKIAFSLVFGLVFSLSVAYFTSEKVETYNSNVVERTNPNGRKEGRTVSTLAKEERVYHPTLILISFAGGFGIGYLLYGKIKFRSKSNRRP